MRRIIAITILAIMMTNLIIPGGITITAFADNSEMTDEQRNAIAMLNFITVLTQEINDSKNSRLYLENAYSELINNSYPNAVDEMTLSQMTGLLDVMEAYRMLEVKRERLQYIYEQNQAQAIRAAVPNPVGVLSAIGSFDPKKMLGAIVYMAVDSATSYMAYTKESELQYLKDGWALDDEEAETLHQSRKQIFNYMVEMVKEYHLPGDQTLTESTVKEFVKWENDKNVVGRIRFLETNRDVYSSYGGYWIILADSYYNNNEYKKCLEALQSYHDLKVRILRKDYSLANVLPLGITSALECLSEDEYVEKAESYAQEIIDNTDNYDWSLRYFSAQTFMDLYAKTQKKSFLERAYDIALDNCNYLVSEQVKMNEEYLSSIELEEVPKGSTKEKKTEIEKYNDLLEEERETALPPVYEPLRVNCELLFGIAEELKIPDDKKAEIDGILHLNGSPLFLTVQLDKEYWQISEKGNEISDSSKDYEVVFSGNSLILPARILSENAEIKVYLMENGKDEAVEITDWVPREVHREEENDISTFEAAYKSKTLADYHWSPDTRIRIVVSPYPNIDLPGYEFNFMANGTKNEWYDWLMFWEGHKNNWYDYFLVWDNSVVFEQVDDK